MNQQVEFWLQFSSQRPLYKYIEEKPIELQQQQQLLTYHFQQLASKKKIVIFYLLFDPIEQITKPLLLY